MGHSSKGPFVLTRHIDPRVQQFDHMIYLHIGPHKTGTSTLQAWLAANRKLLTSLGYCYPGTSENHHILARQVSSHARRRLMPPLFGEYLKQIDDYANGIISSENLDALDDREIKAFRTWLGDRPVTIVVYARAPWDRSASMLGEQLKRLKRTRWGSEWGTNFKGVLPGLTDRSSLPSILQAWSSVFGRSNIKLRVLDKATLVGGGLITDFLDAIGVRAGDVFQKSLSVPVKNEMPGADQLRILRCASEVISPGKSDNTAPHKINKLVCRHIADLLIRASAETDIDFKRASLLSANEVRLFKKAASDQTKFIAERYLDCSADKVFSEPEWSLLPSESFDWRVTRIPYRSLEQLVVNSAVMALDERSFLAQKSIKKLSQLGERTEIPAAAAVWLFTMKSPVLLALHADKPLKALAACACIGQAWSRVFSTATAQPVAPSAMYVSQLLNALQVDAGTPEILSGSLVSEERKPGPRQLVALAVQAILIAGGGRDVIDAYWRRGFSSARKQLVDV